MNAPELSTMLQTVCGHCHTTNRIATGKPLESARCGKCKAQLFAGEAIEVPAREFMRHLQGNNLPVLVDFWAPWCAPCRMMAPVIATAAQRYAQRIRVLKLNTEEAPELAAQFRIRSIPTLALFYRGTEIARDVGAMDWRRLVSWIDAKMAATS